MISKYKLIILFKNEEQLTIYSPQVIAIMENKTSLLWSVSGKQGSEWKEANVAVGQHGNYHIGIRANTDIGSPEGHMAIDDTMFFG